jgi:hypothetical protein
MIAGGREYSGAFSAIAVSAAQDLFEVNGSSSRMTWVTGIELGQYTDFGDAQDENLSCTWIQAHSTSGSGGGTITPTPNGADAAFGGTLERNNTTQATGGSPITGRGFTWNVRQGYVMHWDPTKWILVPASGRIVLAQLAPVDSITMNGTIFLYEVG